MASWRRPLLLLVGSLLLPALSPAQDLTAKGFKLAPASPRAFSPEDLAAGKLLYEDHCSQCHGDAGDGQGVMADLLDPRPRDFTRGVYKIRQTMQGELPTDEDIFRIVGKGMPGTSMPAWQGLLTDEQIWQVVGHLESFSEDVDRRLGQARARKPGAIRIEELRLELRYHPSEELRLELRYHPFRRVQAA